MSLLSFVFGIFCHQLPGRSPQIGDHVFPLCYRCSGLHLGLLVGYIFQAASGGLRRRLPAWQTTGLAGLLTIPYLVDSFGNGFAVWSSPGWLRAMTGAGYGVVLAALLLPFAQGFRPEVTQLRPSLAHASSLFWPVLVAFSALWMLVTVRSMPMFYMLSLVAFLGLLCMVINVAAALWRLKTGLSGWHFHASAEEDSLA